MDAVEKAAEALHKRYCVARTPRGAGIECSGPTGVQIEDARAVLAAVGYPAHQSSDEGTCWCPVAEQAGRERDALQTQVTVFESEVEDLHNQRDALRAERDRYQDTLRGIAFGLTNRPDLAARDAVGAALDPEETP